jgi:hypothetical protein
MLKKVKGKLVAVSSGASLALFGAQMAMAQGTGFAAAVTGTVDDAKSDVTTVGIAVLGVAVLIACIAWIRRAAK